MNRKCLMLVGIFVAGSFGWADDAKPVQDVSAYLDQLQVKLEHTAQRVNQPTGAGSSVVGLRGTKQEPISKQLYWKGKTGPTPVAPEEVKLFRTAVEQAKAGKKDDAIGTLKSFEEKYPNSGLKGDANDTLKLLASLPPPAAPASAAATPSTSAPSKP